MKSDFQRIVTKAFGKLKPGVKASYPPHGDESFLRLRYSADPELPLHVQSINPDQIIGVGKRFDD
jgi:hypothetical protein